ncbi:MAG: hypothetical protein ACRDLL_11390 [Solirubrobacterales bacterium]
MTYVRSASRSLCLAGLVLGLITLFTAASARAEVGAQWAVGDYDAKETPASVQANKLEKGITLLTTVLKSSVEFSCSNIELINVELIGEGKLKEGGKAKFTGCLTKIKGVESKACVPHSKGQAAGTVESLETKGEIVLHEKAGITKLEPKSGETLVTLEMGEECPFGEKIPILGKLTLKDPELTTLLVQHLIVQGPLTELWVISKTAEHVATVDGEAKVKLSGAHEGAEWCGAPG